MPTRIRGQVFGRPDIEGAHAPAPLLRAAREARGMTLEELSAATGYEVRALKAIEANPEKPLPVVITAKLSAVLNVTTDEIRGRSETGLSAQYRVSGEGSRP